MKQLTAPDLAELIADGRDIDILDVREVWETRISKLDNSVHIPMGQIPARIDELSKDKMVVCLCHHGVRSHQVALFLEHHGFNHVFNLHGGIDAWSRQVDTSCPTY